MTTFNPSLDLIEEYHEFDNMRFATHPNKSQNDASDDDIVIVPMQIIPFISQNFIKVPEEELVRKINDNDLTFFEKSHIDIGIDEYEDQLLSFKCFEQEMEELPGMKMNENNKYYPKCLGYNTTNKGHLYIVEPSEQRVHMCSYTPPIYQEQIEDLEEEKVFKIGKSCNIFTRLSWYKPLTKLYYCVECPHSLGIFEQLCVKALVADGKFERRINPRKNPVYSENSGYEYFQGNKYNAKKIIDKLYDEFYMSSIPK